ncbi:unnamed protein product, partial [Iphiclides podalirius]
MAAVKLQKLLIVCFVTTYVVLTSGMPTSDDADSLLEKLLDLFPSDDSPSRLNNSQVISALRGDNDTSLLEAVLDLFSSDDSPLRFNDVIS